MMALCMAMLVFAASCGNKKAETTAKPAKVEVEVITDSASYTFIGISNYFIFRIQISRIRQSSM